MNMTIDVTRPKNGSQVPRTTRFPKMTPLRVLAVLLWIVGVATAVILGSGNEWVIGIAAAVGVGVGQTFGIHWRKKDEEKGDNN
jgi:hypothetical protein